jgi:hypothetical protein
MPRSDRDSGEAEAWISSMALGIAQIAVVIALAWFLATAISMRASVNIPRPTLILALTLAAGIGAAILIRGVRSFQRGLRLRSGR